mgnify:FL=1
MQEKYETYIELGPLGEKAAKVWYDYLKAEPTSYDEPDCPQGMECIHMIVTLDNKPVDIWDELTEERQQLIIEMALEARAESHH